jgi:predicted O-linked N-acetylglucosamine transferase (SPINDLY family)
VTPPSAIDELYRNAIRLHQHGQAAEAEALYDRILQQRPEHAGALHLKGVLALQAGDVDRAISLIEHALALEPRHGLALTNLGVAYRSAGRLDDSVAALRRALALEPNSRLALANLGQALNRAGNIAESIVYNHRALGMEPGELGLQSSVLFAENYLAETDPVELAQRARAVGELIARANPSRTHHENDPDPERPLRVGFVSGDLRSHPVGRFLLGALRGFGTESRLELFAYANSREEDAVTAALRGVIPNWRNVTSTPDTELDAQIAGDRIDVLFDMSGHTSSHRLGVFARKPAPVAVTWIGYFATTGLTAIDYVLANRWVVPEAEENQWVEQVWRLPDTYLCFTTPADAPMPGPLPALAAGHVTFGSFNNFNKLNEGTLATWARLMDRVPGSRLLLRSSGPDNPSQLQSLEQRLEAAGIDRARVRIDPKITDYAAHLRSYAELDIALDPFPYNGGTTTVEALYMGVPVLVRAGDRYVAHMGESILHNAGLAGWIAADEAAYPELGARLAGDLASIAALRAGLRERMLASPLFDAPHFARNLEAAIRGMWRIWCAAERRG